LPTNVACAKVANFQRSGWTALGGGNLDTTYTWAADENGTAAPASHLATCTIAEEVFYPSSDNPFNWPFPMNAASANPTFTSATGPPGNLTDHQFAPDSFIQPPLAEASFTADQRFFYNCTCEDTSFHPLPGNSHFIVRSVYDRDGWFYEVDKDGEISQQVLQGLARVLHLDVLHTPKR
jgi:hypothetical protein